MWRPRKWRHKVTPWCPHRCGPFFHITLHTVLELSWSTQPAINSKMLVSVTCCDQWFLIQATSHQWQYFALLLNVVKDVFQRSFQRDAVETWFPLKRYKRRAYVFGCSENYQEGNCEPGCLSTGKDQILLLVHAAVILFVVLVSGLYYYKHRLNRSCCWPCDYIGRHKNRPRSQAVKCRWRLWNMLESDTFS